MPETTPSPKPAGIDPRGPRFAATITTVLLVISLLLALVAVLGLVTAVAATGTWETMKVVVTLPQRVVDLVSTTVAGGERGAQTAFDEQAVEQQDRHHADESEFLAEAGEDEVGVGEGDQGR